MLRVLITSIFTYFIVQFIASGEFNYFLRKPHYALCNILSVFAFYSFFNMFLWNYEINFLVTITFFYILSVAMYYVHEFRGTNLNFADIASIGTAKEVALGYKWTIKPIMIVGLFFIIFEYVFQIKYKGIEIFKNYHKVINGIDSINVDIYRFFWYEIGNVLLFFVSFNILRDLISKNPYDYSLFAGDNEGYIYNFFSSVPLFHRSTYDYKKQVLVAKRFIYDSFTKFNYIKNFKKQKISDVVINEEFKDYATINNTPHIIVIMNESFGTLQRRVKTNIRVTPYYDNLEGVIKGNLYVNTFGGGTANTEFEFLTGMTIGNVSYPVMPYNNYVHHNKYSLARYFNNIGYKTVAMHPYTASNYHRNTVYKHFGFDELIFYKDFRNKSFVRKYVSDQSMYEEVIRRYRISKAQLKKMFLFGVTMQNHSGYQDFRGAQVFAYGNDEKFMQDERIMKDRKALDAYLSLMKISDDAIRILIDYFDRVEDRVVILFFGDHNANFGTAMNRVLYNTKLDYIGTNAYATPFFIYDNKHKEEKFVREISANFLSLLLLDKANLPYDQVHNLLKDEYEKYSVYNYHKAKDKATGKYVDIENDKYMMLLREYLKI